MQSTTESVNDAQLCPVKGKMALTCALGVVGKKCCKKYKRGKKPCKSCPKH